MENLDLKSRLQNVLYAQKFCCICLASDSAMYSFDDCVMISQCERTTETTIGCIVENLIRDQTPKLLSRNICKTCKNEAANSYTFIENSKHVAEVFGNFFSQLEGRVEDIMNMLETSNDFANTLIVLNNPSPISYICPEPIKSESEISLKVNQYTCDYCNKTFTAKQNIAYHILKVHNKHLKTKLKKNAHKQKCPDRCEEQCEHERYIDSYTIQKESGSKNIKCPDCNYICNSKMVLISHVNIVHLKCYKYKLTTGEKLAKPKKKHDNPYSRPLTDRIFAVQRRLVNKSTANTRKTIYSYCCFICNMSFNKATERALHMQQHDPDEKPTCRHCDEQFDTIEECKHHITKCKFKASVKHECRYCTFISGSYYNLEGHINRYHLKVAPYQCDKCDKRFTYRTRLYEHSKTHKDVKTHMCTVCDSFFRGPTALKKHMRLHTGEKPNLCEICGEGFISASVRNLHKLKKHSVKNVQCPLCDSKFYTLPLMRSHFKKVHWHLKGEQFDVRKVEGLKEEHYDLFRDRRLISLK